MALPDLLLDRAVAFIPVLLSLTVHEWAHAWTAWRLGDDTAKMLGRVSLNPIDHIDPVGTLLLPLLGVPFGWAKPVPINPLRFRPGVSMSMGMLLAVAAGPISNLCLAAASAAGLVAMSKLGLPEASAHHAAFVAVDQLLRTVVLINVLLACFNLLPIPPLDGSRIVDVIVPATLRPVWETISSMGPILLAAVVLLPMFLGFSLLAWPIRWATELLSRIP